MKKLLVMMTAMVLCCSILCGCEYASVETENDQDVSMFVVVERASRWFVAYHKETKVMYVVSTGSYNSGNFVLLVNPDGTPMVWDEE